MHRRVEDGSGGGGEREKKKIEEAKTASHRCRTCCKMGNPITEVEIKCRACQFIEKFNCPNTARDNDDNDNSDHDGEFSEADLRGLLGDLRRLNHGHYSKEDDDDNNDDNGVSHHRNETPNDSTNKLSNIRIEDKDVAQEKFLHDHRKCIESQQKSGMNSFDLDLVLPGHKHGHGHNYVRTAEHKESKQAKADPCSPCGSLELVDMPVPALSPTDETSTPLSPSTVDSTPSSSFAKRYDGPVACTLRDEEEEDI